MASFTTLTSPATPSISTPANGATAIDRNPTITASAFSSSESFTHSSSTWQLATDSGFSSVVWSKADDATNKTSIVVNGTNGTFAGALAGKTKLALSTQYYVRVLYKDSDGGSSAYSTGSSFTVRAATYNKNSVLVQGPVVKENVVFAGKPSHIGVREEAPSGESTSGNVVIDDTTNKLYWYNGSWFKVGDESLYAVAAKGVTNGDTHDHNGGDGGQIDHTTLANKGTNTHAQIDAALPTFVVKPASPDAYTITNAGTDRTYDANATTVEELADVLATLLGELKTLGIVG